MKDDPTIVDAEVVEQSAHDTDNDKSQQQDIKRNFLSAPQWIRFIFMVLFAVIACVASYVVTILVIIQFLFALVCGRSDQRLQEFGANISTYIYQILQFLTYNSEDKPFPFTDWPSKED